MTAVRPRILIITTGGTIAMTPSVEGGVRPALTGADLVAAVPGIEDVADIDVLAFAQVGSANLTFAHGLKLAAEIRAQREVYDGVVVTQGTDTLEEMAFLLDCLLAPGRPVVFTGAMRPPMNPGAEGPANIKAAVIAAGSPDLDGLGVVAVMNDEIHAARTVVKAHTASTAAFTSPGAGSLGFVAEGRVRLHARPMRARLPDFSALEAPLPRVALLPMTFSDDGALLDAVAAGNFDGAVIAAFGAGHVPEAFVPRLEALAARIPILLASRAPAGPAFSETYGYAGAEIDLIARGLIPAGPWPAHKARILLTLLLAKGTDRDGLTACFR